MTRIDPELQVQVDAQLLEQGAFTSLELLLNSGRLFYEDYERWRRRELALLDGALMGAPEKIRDELARAAGYARSIGLKEEAQEFPAWQDSEAGPRELPPGTRPAPASLRISADAQLQRLIGARFVPAQDAPQMDLFFDNPVVAITNGLVRGLCARDADEARRLLDQLYAQAPTHADLAMFDQLLAALERLGRPVAAPRQEMQTLIGITPGAKRLLGTQARDLLAPLWSQLAHALATTAFLPQEPELHASFAFAQAQDWRSVEASITAEPQWWQHASLCLRLAHSAFYRGRRIEALAAWAHLCWLAPECAAAELEQRQQPDRGIAALWQRFLEVEDALELQVERAGSDAQKREVHEREVREREVRGRKIHERLDNACLDTRDFPAWLLLHEPGLVQQLPEDLPRSDGPGEQHYRCVHRLIQARRERRSEEELALRKTLHAAHPVLFACLQQQI